MDRSIKNTALRIYFFLLAIFIVFLLYKKAGIYYAEDDVLTSYLFFLSGFTQNPHLFFYEEFFGVKSLISFIQSQFLEYNIYGIYKFSSLVIALFVITDVVFMSSISYTKKFFLFVLFLSLFAHYFIFLNNVSLSFLFCFISLILLICISSRHWGQTKFLYVYYFLMVFFAVTSRFQIALVAHILILPFSMLFLNKQSKLASVFSTFLFASLYLSYGYFSNDYPELIKEFHHHELSIYDRNDLVIDEIYGKEGTNQLVANMNATSISILAKALFINDQEYLSKFGFPDILKHKTTYDFYFNNTKIWHYLKNKIKDFIFATFSNFLFLLLAFVLSVFLLVNSFNIKGLTFLSLYIILPFTILIPASVPMKFIGIYISSGVFVIVFTIFVKQDLFKQNFRRLILFFVLMLSIYNLFHYTNALISSQKESTIQSEKIFVSFQKDYSKGITPFIAYFDYHQSIPNDLFFKFYPIKMCFVDLAGYTAYPSFANLNKQIFGKANYNSLLARYQHIYTNKQPIYISNFMKNFITRYLSEVYDYEIFFIEEEVFEGLSKCYISQLKKHEKQFR